MVAHKMAVVLPGFGLVSAYFLVTEHAAHAWGLLPYLLLLACPLMRVFHGHGGHGHEHGKSDAMGS